MTDPLDQPEDLAPSKEGTVPVTDARQARIREGMELTRERNGTPTRGRACPRCSTVIESLAVETYSPTMQRLEAFPCRHQWLRAGGVDHG